MFKSKELSITGIALFAAVAVYTLIPVFIPGVVSLLELPLPDGGYSLFFACGGTALLFILSGFIISLLAGDQDSAVDLIVFLYAAAFCIISRAKSYDVTGIFPGVLIVVSDIASCIAMFSGIRMLGVFFSLTRVDRNDFIFHKIAYISLLVLVVRYLLVLTSVSDFWNFSFDIAGDIMLWFFFTLLIGFLFFLLKKVPRQASQTMRIIILSLWLGFLPFLCYVSMSVPKAENSFKMYWTPQTVLTLLAIPAGFLCATLQKLKKVSDNTISKLMTSCAALISLECACLLWNVASGNITILLILCPVVYQIIYIPLESYMHPKLTAIERSLDSLERTAFRCSDASRILEVASDWIVSMLNPEFVAFYGKADKEGKKECILYSEFRNEEIDRNVLDAMLKERLNSAHRKEDVMMHGKTGFSVPMYQLHEPVGYIFVGARSEKEQFSNAEIKLMTPVSRILMESMMVLDLRKQADYVSQMQNQIVFSFADMIESRDGTTGQHIKRTSTIVSLLARNLREHNLYADKLLPSDYEMIALAAPLHDIGKIKVPDSILSKPGKLTPEEFETIKTHPVEGEKIINRTMSHIENERYLRLAREMALYHHEKWNGKGYPEGLSGEAIPVSARIMAIADVFDALCSTRSYKEAYSVSQAFAILEESRGQHFEPCLVDAMKVLKPELEKIYSEV